MLEVNRIGFTELSDRENAGTSPNETKAVNIILVHGLKGHPFRTWASNQEPDDDPPNGSSSRRQQIRSLFKSTPNSLESNLRSKKAHSTQHQTFWPKDFLTEDIPQARIWVYGYNADVIGGLFQANNKNSVSGHGRDLKVRLERDIDNEDPIIFVAHSLGGIIVKDALWKSEACRKRTRFVIFLGTPHRGSTMAGWGGIASNLARLTLQDSNKKILENLEVDNEVLDNIHDRFIEIAFDDRMRIHSFQEGRGMSGIKGLDGKVVGDISSKLGLPKIETVESIDANHRQMARCSDRCDESYRFISGVLKHALREINWDSRSLAAPATYVLRDRIPMANHKIETAHTGGPHYCLPFLRNRHFTGRTEKLRELEKKLFIHHDCQKLAIVGLGGVGKTQMALELAYTVKDRWPEYSIYWVPVVSGETFEQAYRDIVNQCPVVLSSEENKKESVRRYLSSDLAGKWLLIFDNSDDPDVLFGVSDEVGCRSGGVADYFPQSENGITLFTTRHREMAVSLAGSDVIDIPEMNQEEAEAFFTSLLTQTIQSLDDRTVTADLLTELEFLPLAIAQAAAYLNTMQITVQEYLSLLRSTEQNMVSLLNREFRDGTRYKTSSNAVASTWLISFEQIRQSDPVAGEILSFISCIENKAIPRSILPAVEPEEQMVHAIGTLRAYAFITKRADGESYDMHRLVHRAIKIWLERTNKRREVEETVAVQLAEKFPLSIDENQTIWREQFAHASHFLQSTRALEIEARYALCQAFGRCLLQDGRDEQAVFWLSEDFMWRQGRFSEDHPSQLASMQRLAVAYGLNLQTEKAVELLEKVAAIQKGCLNEDDPSRLWSQHCLAMIYSRDGQTGKAIELLEGIVTIQEINLPKDHPSRLDSQRVLAATYRRNGQVAKAIKLFEEIVKKGEDCFAEDHPDRLIWQHEFALAYNDMGQFGRAIELLEHVVVVHETSLRGDHPDLLGSQHDLAVVYRDNGQAEKAVKLIEHVVAVRKKTLRADHPSRVMSERLLQEVFAQQGRDTEVEAESSASQCSPLIENDDEIGDEAG